MKNSFLFIVLLLAVTSCQQQTHTEHSTPVKRAKQNVEVEKVSTYSGLTSFQYSGLVEAKQKTPLSFKTPGTVVEILVDEGQYVKKGQLLAKLDAYNAQNTYELALQKQQQAQDAYDRMKPMHENGTLPEIKWVEVETGLSQATTAAAIAKRRIGDAELYAPKSGVIGNKNIELGVNVLPSAAAFDLLDINTVYVNIPVPENELGKLKKGQSAQINIAAIGETRSGKIHQIGVTANPITHSYPVKIEVNNQGWKLKPGMVCNVRLAGSAKVEGIAISNKALQRNASGQQFVYVVKDSTVTAQAVQTFDLIGNQAIINSLSENDLVVVSGQHKLTEGSVVNIINTVD
ncbi:efflux RND transporter periplasmic adaptor subunit [Phaeodactylibacter luteus]|uniref:Efflux RND transporter periplasmic adaptor subunit n=1 Tax=Phaeodactylibacter luteus TaxID=1564516 RepID=A0A5C6RGF6_9BACT|nr:efflux RND transporter periplasmic adaptor subunit [Phaeodactylibacter luteus]TXB59410.1 efflux RND transporter periplasmic adaptor subunit [Phaeodactylibacter luteus]